MELLHSLPKESDYIPIREHQSQTPASFYSGPPVLHLISCNATLTGRPSDLRTIPALAKLAGIDVIDSNSTNGVVAENHPMEGVEPLEPDHHASDIDIWAASDKLVLIRPSLSIALAIPYPSIALHAVASAALYLQLTVAGSDSAQFDEYDTENTIEMTLIPTASDMSTEEPKPVDALYAALSACADLHPDAADLGSDDDEGNGRPSFIIHGNGGENEPLWQVTAPAGDSTHGLPPPMPGSGGWITAENVDQFFDAEGNWKGSSEPPSLGTGAGTVRTREPEAQDDDIGDADETKWRRTDQE